MQWCFPTEKVFSSSEVYKLNLYFLENVSMNIKKHFKYLGNEKQHRLCYKITEML